MKGDGMKKKIVKEIWVTKNIKSPCPTCINKKGCVSYKDRKNIIDCSFYNERK